MKRFPIIIALLVALGMSWTYSFAQTEVVRCETLTGIPYRAEFSTKVSTDEPVTAAGGDIQNAVKGKVDSLYDACTMAPSTPIPGWKDGGSLAVVGMPTAPTGTTSTTPATTVQTASVTVWIPTAVDLTKIKNNEAVRIYVPERAQTFTIEKKEVTSGGTKKTQWTKTAGPAYDIELCYAKYKQLERYNATQETSKRLEGEAFKTAAVKQLRGDLLTTCKNINSGQKGYASFGSILGKDAAKVRTALGGQPLQISCEHLFELYGYTQGEMCLEGIANQTFATNTITMGGNITGVIQRVMGIMAGTIGSVAMLVMIVGGFMMITAGGNEDMVTRGKQAFTYGIIGIVVVFSSYLIVVFVQSLFFAL